jgi:hypothetical protein
MYNLLPYNENIHHITVLIYFHILHQILVNY